MKISYCLFNFFMESNNVNIYVFNSSFSNVQIFKHLFWLNTDNELNHSLYLDFFTKLSRFYFKKYVIFITISCAAWFI